MRAMVWCEATGMGEHTFYLSADGKRYYLFRQNYRKGVAAYYRNGVSLCEAVNFGKSKRNSALIKTMQKLPSYLKYVEKEYGIQVLKQTIKKNKRIGNSHVAA